MDTIGGHQTSDFLMLKLSDVMSLSCSFIFMHLYFEDTFLDELSSHGVGVTIIDALQTFDERLPKKEVDSHRIANGNRVIQLTIH
jgi:hypothetical protein